MAAVGSIVTGGAPGIGRTVAGRFVAEGEHPVVWTAGAEAPEAIAENLGGVRRDATYAIVIDHDAASRQARR